MGYRFGAVAPAFVQAAFGVQVVAFDRDLPSGRQVRSPAVAGVVFDRRRGRASAYDACGS